MPITNEEITKKDLQVMVTRLLIHNAAFLRTVINNQIHIMKALNSVNNHTISNEVNETIKENTEFIEEALNNGVPLFSDLKPPLKDY